MKPLHIIPEHCPFSKHLHIILHTFLPSLPPSTRTSPPLHHHIWMQADTQSFPLFCSTCPNHLNLFRLTTSSTLCTPRRLTNPNCVSHPSATLGTSISPSSVPFSPDLADSLSSSVSVPYVIALWTQALYIFPFTRNDTPRAVRIGNNSLNFAQEHITLALAVPVNPIALFKWEIKFLNVISDLIIIIITINSTSMFFQDQSRVSTAASQQHKVDNQP